METRVSREAQQVVTQEVPVIEGIVTDEDDSIDTVATEEMTGTAETTEEATGASEDADAESEPSAKSRRRTRQRKSFTMDDDVYKLLGTLAKTNGTNRSAFIEQLILMADDLSLGPAGPGAPRSHGHQGRHDQDTVPGDAGTEGRCCRNLAASPTKTQALVEALGQTGVGRPGRTFGWPDSGGGDTPAVAPWRPPMTRPPGV